MVTPFFIKNVRLTEKQYYFLKGIIKSYEIDPNGTPAEQRADRKLMEQIMIVFGF